MVNNRTDRDLLDFVDELARPHLENLLVERETYRHRVLPSGQFVYTISGETGERIPTGAERTVQTMQRDPLLKQLRQAITEGIGVPATSSAGGARDPLNSAALALYTQIEESISKAFVDVMIQTTGRPKPVELLPEKTLTRWCAAWLGTDPSRDDIAAATNQLRTWRTQIQDLYDPPRLRELLDPCPRCGERYAFQYDRGESYGQRQRTQIRVSALEMVYRVAQGSELPDVMQIECKFEPYKWTGSAGVDQYLADRADFTKTGVPLLDREGEMKADPWGAVTTDE